MAPTTLALTHYFPWDGDEQKAVCGASVRDAARQHRLEPTCSICAAHLEQADEAIDAAIELTALPLDAAEADALTPRRPMSALGEELFALANLHARLRLMQIQGGRR